MVRDVDLADDLWGSMFEPLKDAEYFARVVVDHGTVMWPNGLDLDPLVLHGDSVRDELHRVLRGRYEAGVAAIEDPDLADQQVAGTGAVILDD